MNYNDIRRKTNTVRVGGISIGGTSKIPIQSMTNTDTHDHAATLAQIRALESAGCDIVRVTVPDMEAVRVIEAIKGAGTVMPIVADIHFDYKIAIACAEAGFDKIRINPGNIGDDSRVGEVCRACRAHGVPIRIGVNSGSLEKHILAKYGAPTAEALCESATYHYELLEKFDFYDTVISIKASNVKQMIDANRLLASKCEYPIHIGVTEAGSEGIGLIKSAAGVSSLLCDGIGDTVRISLTADPVSEISAAKKIFKALDIKGQAGMNVISCPTCGRTKIDLIDLVARFEAAVEKEGLVDADVTVALMGCAVNGPGEAREADIGIAGGVGEALLFSHGEIIGKVKEDEIITRLIDEIKKRKI